MLFQNSARPLAAIEAPSSRRHWLRKVASCTAIVALAACGGGGGDSGGTADTGSSGSGNNGGGGSAASRQVVVVGHALAAAPGSPPNGRMWVNGVEKALPLSATGQSTASAATFAGSTPIVAGHLLYHTGPLNAYHEAKLWHDGQTPQFLPTTATGSHVPRAIQATASEVHVAGTREGSYHKVVYWKNGQVQYLTNPDDTTYEGAMGLAVNGEGVVYICGYDFGSADSVWFNPVCWRNGVKSKLSTSNGVATGVATRSFDVYVSGVLRFADAATDVAVVWTNGTVRRLGDGVTPSVARAVAVGGLTDVYVIGAINPQSTSVRAALWKNGTEQALEGAGPGSEAYAVQVVGNDVYVAGHIGQTDGKKQRAALWVNGKLQVLSDGSLAAWGLGLAVR